MIWFTSDLHFGHEKEFLWRPRGFESLYDYAEQTIENFNSVVTPEDTVYILGDCMLKDDEYGIACLKRLNGKKYLAIGNHDSETRIQKYLAEGIFNDIQYGYRFRQGKTTFYCQHYPAMMGNYKDKCPTVCLAGHTHSPDKFQNMDNGCYNIALDAHKCYPVSIETIVKDVKEYYATHPRVEYPDNSPYCASCMIGSTCSVRYDKSKDAKCPLAYM